MRCPFHPICEADLELLVQRVGIGGEETETVYPPHTIAGPNSWRGRCPAGHALIAPDGSLTDALTAMLDYLRPAFQRSIDERAAAAPAQELVTKPPVTRKISGDWVRHRWFGVAPGRETETKAGGMNAGSGDSLRDQLMATTHMVTESAGQAQEQLAAVTETLEAVDEVIESIATKIEAAQLMAAAAVGATSSGELPESATNMVAELVAARSTLDDMKAALAVTALRKESVYASLVTAVNNANAYRSAPW